jgi:hypothetical protein
MEFDFLKQFPKRMKNVGAYALLFRNSLQKQTWKQYGFETIYEQTNLIFSVLLFIMEQSLREEICTIDEIGYFIDGINVSYYKKSLSYEECKELAEFIITVIVCDEGRAMYFQGFSYETSSYEEIHISFITNKIMYLPGEVKRTSYYLTEDGYNLILQTLEIESNMKLTIHEMIFKLHLEKASYDKAADDIKNIFNLLRIQLQKIQEAMRLIRQNALGYSVSEYSKVLEQNMSTIDETKDKFLEYREYVKRLVLEMEKQSLNVEKLEEKEIENLSHLKVIEGYLNRSLDEYQKILLNHFDLKTLYTKELEALSAMSLVSRFQFQRDFYQNILKKPEALENLDLFLRPLFSDNCNKIYHLDKSFAFQKIIRERELEEEDVVLDFDSEEWLKEQTERLKHKWRIYENVIQVLLHYAKEEGSITLSQLKEQLREEDREALFPNIEIFREIMIELLKEQNFNILKLRKEQEEHFTEVKQQFLIGSSLLQVIEDHSSLANITEVAVYRAEPAAVVTFEHIPSENGKLKNISCSETVIQVREGVIYDV